MKKEGIGVFSRAKKTSVLAFIAVFGFKHLIFGFQSVKVTNGLSDLVSNVVSSRFERQSCASTDLS